MKNLYLERLKRMSDEELLSEVERQGKTMSKRDPLTQDEKQRAKMCFRFVLQRPEISQDNRQMIATALRVLEIL